MLMGTRRKTLTNDPGWLSPASLDAQAQQRQSNVLNARQAAAGSLNESKANLFWYKKLNKIKINKNIKI